MIDGVKVERERTKDKRLITHKFYINGKVFQSEEDIKKYINYLKELEK